MISRSKKQLRPRLYVSGLVSLLIFILSGCDQFNDTSGDTSPDPQTQDGTDNQPPSTNNDTSPDPQTQDDADGQAPNGDNDTTNPPDSGTPITSNQPPKAVIAPAGAFTSGQTVTLKGAGSSDPDGDTLTYQWEQTEGPNITLSDTTSDSLTFVAPAVEQATQFSFKLTVNDSDLSNSASVSVQISPTVDNTPPSVVSKLPQPDMSGVANDTVISAVFDEALLETSIDDQSLLLSQNGSQVPGVVSYDSANKTITNKPETALSSGTTYTATLANTLKDLANNAFAGDSWSFTTASDTNSNTNSEVDMTCDESELLAFPCAEGYGKHATGGRGGKVCEVTNLNSSGAGSFKDCASKSGTTVVFRVSGTINGGASVASNVTIAGQTAPGDGVQLTGALGIGANNIIVRYLRVRLKGSGDAISGGHGNENIIIDHVSASWSTDEVFSTYFNKNLTIQWSMITEANSGDHKFGGIWGNNYSTYHHNFFAHNSDRTPRIASGSGFNDVRNNVIYNWSNLPTYGCEVHQVGDSSHVGCSTNVVANYYKAGPATPDDSKTRIIAPTSRTGEDDYGDFYVAENYLYGSPEVTADNWLGVVPHYWGKIERDVDAIPGLKLDMPSEYMPINQQTAEAAYESVLEHAGCSKPNRDSHDARIVEETRTGTATHGNGHVSSPTELPTLNSTTPPVDSDHDGMPDEWETANGLDPNNPEDRNKTYGPGYTMLEKYINSLDSFH